MTHNNDHILDFWRGYWGFFFGNLLVLGIQLLFTTNTDILSRLGFVVAAGNFVVWIYLLRKNRRVGIGFMLGFAVLLGLSLSLTACFPLGCAVVLSAGSVITEIKYGDAGLGILLFALGAGFLLFVIYLAGVVLSQKIQDRTKGRKN